MKKTEKSFTVTRSQAVAILTKGLSDLRWTRTILVTHLSKTNKTIHELERALKTAKKTTGRKITFKSK